MLSKNELDSIQNLKEISENHEYFGFIRKEEEILCNVSESMKTFRREKRLVTNIEDIKRKQNERSKIRIRTNVETSTNICKVNHKSEEQTSKHYIYRPVDNIPILPPMESCKRMKIHGIPLSDIKCKCVQVSRGKEEKSTSIHLWERCKSPTCIRLKRNSESKHSQFLPRLPMNLSIFSNLMLNSKFKKSINTLEDSLTNVISPVRSMSPEVKRESTASVHKYKKMRTRFFDESSKGRRKEIKDALSKSSENKSFADYVKSKICINDQANKSSLK
ncbi:unnamed protein product [Blepharisma stoltei]|uniref:Uncharacterized protein n=1 Tax=Blepharisma stoltei TaxID=1481888 RepID=A0AAU9IT02_9CILI|nr:unnamed protein product [Blepharisma stoltei]